MKRSGIQRKTPMRRGVSPKRTPMKTKAPKDRGFDEQTKAAVRRRSGNQCEVHGCPRGAAHFHHRKLRGHGDHRDVNCLHVCAEHHTRIHANPELSYALGWMVQSWLDPEHIPVLPVALRGK